MSQNQVPLQRRRVLKAAVMTGAVGFAGCAGDDNESESDDDIADPSDENGETVSDDEEEDATGNNEAQPDVSEDFDSYISESSVTYEQPEESVMQMESYTEWNLADNRAYRRHEVEVDGNAAPTMEYYMIDERTYQRRPDGCVSFDGRLIRRGEIGDAGIVIPDEQDIETAENVEQLAPTEVDGERVDVWRFVLGQPTACDGEMTVHVSQDTGYVVLIIGWYETGHCDNPAMVEFEQRNHSFDEDLSIEPPTECTDGQ